MALAAVTTEEVAGKRHGAVRRRGAAVLTREAKKRREAAEAFDGAGRAELAERERDEGDVLGRLPARPSSSDDELRRAGHGRRRRRRRGGPRHGRRS